MISLDDFKKQWKTFLIGASMCSASDRALGRIAGGSATTSAAAPADGYAQALDFVVAGTGAPSGGTISVIIVEEAALALASWRSRIFPALIAGVEG